MLKVPQPHQLAGVRELCSIPRPSFAKHRKRKKTYFVSNAAIEQEAHCQQSRKTTARLGTHLRLQSKSI
jgi:hypothetical protein